MKRLHASYYIYLVSSLPMLHFGMRPPFSFERLLRMCDGLISDCDIDILKQASAPAGYDYDGDHPTLRRWRAFDGALRNELVKIRAARKKIDPAKYLRYGGYTDPSIAHIALHAHRIPSILEAESILDEARWHFLDELAAGHYFDMDFLVTYAIKLLILERWERVDTLDKTHTVEKLVSNAYQVE